MEDPPPHRESHQERAGLGRERSARVVRSRCRGGADSRHAGILDSGPMAKASRRPRRVDGVRRPADVGVGTADRRSSRAQPPPSRASAMDARTPLFRTRGRSGARQESRCRCRGCRCACPLKSGPVCGQRTRRRRKLTPCASGTRGNGTPRPLPAHRCNAIAPVHTRIGRIERLGSCDHHRLSLPRFAMASRS